MQFFKNPNFDFQSRRKSAFIISGALIFIGLISLILHGGPKYSIDFLGGLSIRLQFENPVSESSVRNALATVDLGGSEVKTIKEIGSEPDILIRVKQESAQTDAQELVKNAMMEYFPDNDFEVRSVDRVGPRIGSELRANAFLAVLVTLVLILIYLSWRFEFRFGVGAVAALFHDVLITLGIFSILNLEISLAIVAAFLTIVGYSLNDTIVVFDRIRENLKKHSTDPLEHVINLSINETISRTIVTSGTTLLVVLMLFIFGGQVIHDFAFALLIGVVIGTYSSMYIAAPILLEWRKRETLKKKRSRR
ncbi:MAG: protein translocase subunit SecF [candidate division Zixibacteria bacterium]|nr:protein translocase subunit SecF [Candidatus Tariuqbacter arcticus]